MKQEIVFNILKTGKNVFLTGSAGTGKTFLLQKYLEFLKNFEIKHQVVAPTGLAASHLGGKTIHSFFGIGLREKVDEKILDSLLQKKYLYNQIAKIKVLIIDEISMVSPDLFESIDKILRAFKFSSEPFGGVQIVLSGDFFQLPPIKSNKFAWQSSIWKELNLKSCYLTEKFRHTDKELADILDNIRQGNIDENIFKKILQKKENGSDVYSRLYTHNIDVDKINQQELDKIEELEEVFEAETSGSQSNVDKLFKSSLLSETLILKKGAVVMFIKNNEKLGYVNGSMGVIIDFSEDGYPIVKLNSGDEVEIIREIWNFENDKGKILAEVKQIPLKLAWAITVHKSQGMTLEAVELDLSKTFELGQGYVALSRVKTWNNLKVLGLNDMALKVHPLSLKVDEKILISSQQNEKDFLDSDFKNEQKKFLGCVGIKKEKIKEALKYEFNQQPIKENKTKRYNKKDRYLETEELLNKVKSLEELSEKRKLTISTIIKHLGILYDRGIDIGKFKPAEKVIEKVEKALKHVDSGDQLKPIYEYLDEKVSYNDIKLSLIFIS